MIALLGTIALLVMLLSFLVIIHEFGHFFSARWLGVKVDEFGLGYPPKIRTLFSWLGTPFSLNWLPFGGFVRLHGDDGEGSDHEVVSATDHERFADKPQWVRLIVILGGVAVNFLFGFLAFSLTYSTVGIPEKLAHVRVEYVEEASPAAQAGVVVGDELVALGTTGSEQPIMTADGFRQQVESFAGQTMTLSLIHEGQQVQRTIQVRTLEDARAQGKGLVGILPNDTAYVFYPAWQMPARGVVAGMREALGLGRDIVRGLGGILASLFRGSVPGDVMGPVGIVNQAYEMGVVHTGFIGLLHFSGLLSVNLAIMNILPIPMLDGGRAIFVLLETVMGKARRQRWEQRANGAGFLLLLGLILLVTARDVMRIVGKI